jgi:hypothetical protein
VSSSRRVSQEGNQYEAGSNQTLKLEVAFSSEMWVDFLTSCTTLLPEERIPHFLFISKFLSLSGVIIFAKYFSSDGPSCNRIHMSR